MLSEILTRKSVRSYDDRPIEEKALVEILSAGRYAPSWINIQPWKFIVIREEKTKELLYRATGGQKHVLNAPVVIACIADLTAWDKPNLTAVLEKSGLGAHVEACLKEPTLNPTLINEMVTLTRTVEQLSYAIAYMTLQAERSGVGCCIVGAMANELTHGDGSLIAEIKTQLGLGERQILTTLLTLGYEKEPTETKKVRKAPAELFYSEYID